MKKLFLFIFCAVLSIGARAQFSGSGTGTESDPYRIYTEVHLAQMTNFLNQEGVVFELMKDLDLSSYIAENSPSQGWTPIGVESAPFKGVLKGNGHTISGMMINRPNTDNIGLFGYVNSATITDINLESKSIVGKNWIGGIIGNAYGTCMISNCNVTVSGIIEGLCDIGGLVGYIHETSSIRLCSIRSNLTSKGRVSLDYGSIGGLCGTVENSTIQDCNFYGTITGKIKNAGGLFGSIGNSTISNVTGTGNVSGEEFTGGIAGNTFHTNSFTNVRFTGNVKGIQNVSGGFGRLGSGSTNTFNNCHHKGSITNTGDYTGGIVGKSEGACIAEMESCSHIGDIVGKNYVGGIVGGSIKAEGSSEYIYVSTSSSSNTKSVSKPTSDFVSGTDESLVNNCMAIGNITGTSYVGGLLGWDEKSFKSLNWNTGGASSLSIRGYGSYYLWYGDKYTGKYQSVGERYNSGNTIQGTASWSPNIRINTLSYINCYYSGTINGTDNVGGIVGHKFCGRIQNCYTNATVYGGSNVGGIIGNAEGYSKSWLTLKSNITINNTVFASTSNVGRIYGSRGDAVNIGALGSPEGNRALTQTSLILCGVAQDIVDDEQNGTSVGPSMLKLKGNYVSWGWNFDENWNILETESYPYKKYQAAPPVIESRLQSHDTSISGKSLNGGAVYMFYKDRDAVSTTCSGNNWEFTTEELQSGAQVQLYADVEGLTPSYFTTALVKYPGSGTEEDPYRIYSAEDLQGATNSGYFLVMNDIDLTSWINENSPTEGWQAIGRNSTAATYINGDGHTVKGLWINATQGYNGLFSNYSAGYIKNLNVEVAEGKSVKGGDYTGVLIGRMANGQIINCNIKGAVEGTVNVGGVAGYVENASLTNNTYDGSVTTVSANALAGGVTGFAKNVQTKTNIVTATINSTGNASCVGGLFGKAENGTIANSHANANISAAGSNDYVGGLVGYLQTPVTQSYSEGTVTATGENSYTGGLVGMAKVAIDNSYSKAKTNGTLYTAGLVGYTYSSIDKCYAQGDVRGEQYGAGVVGELDGASATLTNSMALNNLIDLTSQSAWGCRVIGGFKNGAAEPTMGNNYALNTMQVSLNGVPQKKTDDNIEGVAKTAEELKTIAAYTALGWNFSGVWEIEEGIGYPYFNVTMDEVLVESIVLNNTTAIVKPGATETLIATVRPDNATKKAVAWTTSNPYVATVENGVVTGVSTGVAVITATTTDGTNLSASCEVTVTNKNVEPVGDDTDITMYDDIIYFENATIKGGQQIVLPLQLKNKMDVASMTFDVYMPEGVEIDKNARGNYNITFNAEANRADASTHTLTSKLQADDAVRVLCYSATAETFLGNEGAVFDFPVTVASAMEAGDYKVVIRNIELTDAQGKSVYIDKVVSTLTVPSYTLGDANDDGKIGTADIMYIVNKILGTPAENFNAMAADVNEDGKIGTADLMMVVQYILNGEFPAVTAAAKGYGAKPQSNVTLKVKPFAINAGETKTITLELDNEDVDASGFVCDVYLPKGLAADVDAMAFNATANRTNAAFHAMPVAVQEDGAVRILCYSANGESLLGMSGAVIDIPVTASADIEQGEAVLTIANQEVVNADGTKVYCPEAYNAKVMIGGVTGVATVSGAEATESIVSVYNAVGIRQSKVQSGLNIIVKKDGEVIKATK